MEIADRLEDLASHVKEFINIRLESMKLAFAEKLSKIMANMIAAVVVVLMLLFFVIFFSTALAYYLGELFGHVWIGFLIVAGLFLLLAFITWSIREKLIRLPVMNAILSQLTNKEPDEED